MALTLATAIGLGNTLVLVSEEVDLLVVDDTVDKDVVDLEGFGAISFF